MNLSNCLISTISGSGFGSSHPIGATGKLTTTPIYIRVKGALSDNFYNNENITISGTGLTIQNVNYNERVGIATSINTPTTTNFIPKKAYAQKGQLIGLKSGNYIVKLINKEGTKVQKIVLKF